MINESVLETVGFYHFISFTVIITPSDDVKIALY